MSVRVRVSRLRQPFERKPEINFRAPFVYAIFLRSALEHRKQNNDNNNNHKTNCSKNNERYSEKIIAQL